MKIMTVIDKSGVGKRHPPSFELLREYIMKNPSITMIWGDGGVGKTTLALQLANSTIRSGKKVFYLYTKYTPADKIVKRILISDPINNNADVGALSNFFVWRANSFIKQTEIIMNWLMQIQKSLTMLGKNKIGLIIIDEISNLLILELNSKEKLNELTAQYMLQLATLERIKREFAIPIILINSYTQGFSAKKVKPEKELLNELIMENENEDTEGKDTKSDEKDVASDTEERVSAGFHPSTPNILSYWADISIKIIRTAQLNARRFSLQYSDPARKYPPYRRLNDLRPEQPSFGNDWTWILKETGF